MGTPQIEVLFDIDANGILSVKAKDKGSGKEQSITIEASSELSEQDIERMKKDAEDHKKEDDEKKLLIESKNAAENAIYTIEKAIKDAGDKIPEDIKKSINTKKDDLKSKLESNNAEEIKSKTTELLTEAQKIGEILNKSAEKQDGTSAKESTDESVKDADAEEVKDDESDAK